MTAADAAHPDDSTDGPRDHEAVPEGFGCIRCGYTLVGLSPAGDCPECGTAIARSLSEDRIADADPIWLRRIILGLALLGWGPWIVLLSIILTLLISLGLAASTASNLFETDGSVIERVVGVILVTASVAMFGGLLMAALGGLLVTTLEPRDEGRERMDEPRQIARWGLLVAVILPIVRTSVEGATGWLPPDSVRFGIHAVAIAAGGSALVALHARLRDFAVRVPSATLAERAERGRVWYRGVTIFATVLMGLWAIHDLAEGVPALGVVASVLSVVAGLGSCAALVVFVIAFFRIFTILDLALSLRSRIRKARDAGDATPATTS